jgi:hypothetical protein
MIRDEVTIGRPIARGTMAGLPKSEKFNRSTMLNLLLEKSAINNALLSGDMPMLCGVTLIFGKLPTRIKDGS